jgi:hypothetical protein
MTFLVPDIGCFHKWWHVDPVKAVAVLKPQAQQRTVEDFDTVRTNNGTARGRLWKESLTPPAEAP